MTLGLLAEIMDDPDFDVTWVDQQIHRPCPVSSASGSCVGGRTPMHYIVAIPIIIGVASVILGLLWLVAAGSEEDGGPSTGLFWVFGMTSPYACSACSSAARR
jgi:hypothetical protein